MCHVVGFKPNSWSRSLTGKLDHNSQHKLWHQSMVQILQGATKIHGLDFRVWFWQWLFYQTTHILHTAPDSTEIVHLRRFWNGIRAVKFEYSLESIWNSTKVDRISPISVGTDFFLQIESQALILQPTVRLSCNKN
jgi:hypothetical protein